MELVRGEIAGQRGDFEVAGETRRVFLIREPQRHVGQIAAGADDRSRLHVIVASELCNLGFQFLPGVQEHDERARLWVVRSTTRDEEREQSGSDSLERDAMLRHRVAPEKYALARA
ncbi:MAG: hypothetical protein SGI72_04940 [Planctomycetota bacterium]|nr:hypothetical protein [Planctomycetota bacterium]